MFEKLYKEAYNEINADNKLLEEILNKKPSKKRYIKFPTLVAAVLFTILIFFTIYPETDVQFEYTSYTTASYTARTEKGATEKSLKNESILFNTMYDLKADSDDLSTNHSPLTMSECIKNKVNLKDNITFTNSDNTKTIISTTNILPVLIDKTPIVINNKEVYIFKWENTFYAEYITNNSYYSNILTENLTKDEFIYILNNTIN